MYDKLKIGLFLVFHIETTLLCMCRFPVKHLLNVNTL